MILCRHNQCAGMPPAQCARLRGLLASQERPARGSLVEAIRPNATQNGRFSWADRNEGSDSPELRNLENLYRLRGDPGNQIKLYVV